MIQYVKRETIIRKIPTIYGFHMRNMCIDGPCEGTYGDEIKIICGIGKNSLGFDAPYTESKSGENIR